MIEGRDDREEWGPLVEVPSSPDQLRVIRVGDDPRQPATVYDEVTFVVDWATPEEEFESSWFG